MYRLMRGLMHRLAYGLIYGLILASPLLVFSSAFPPLGGEKCKALFASIAFERDSIVRDFLDASKTGDLVQLEKLIDKHGVNFSPVPKNPDTNKHHKYPILFSHEIVTNPQAVELFIKKGADINVTDTFQKQNILHHAAHYNAFGSIAKLIDKVDPQLIDAQDKTGLTPFYFLLRGHYHYQNNPEHVEQLEKTIKLFLSKGVDFLVKAENNKYNNVLRNIVQAPVDFNIFKDFIDPKQLNDQTIHDLLNESIVYNNVSSFNYFLDNGGLKLINKRVSYGVHTLLTDAAMAGNLEIVKILVENGANMNHLTSHEGQSVFHLLARETIRDTKLKNIYQVLRFLLKQDATLINTKDRWGHTPLDYVKTMPALVMLTKHGGQSGKGALSMLSRYFMVGIGSIMDPAGREKELR